MAILEVKGLRKAFGGTQVLRGVDFKLEQGQALSIIGSSGSGKTTLLRCLNFLETPSGGTFSVGGETLFDASVNKTESGCQGQSWDGHRQSNRAKRKRSRNTRITRIVLE